MSTDTLSDVLRAVRLTGAVFFDVDAGDPWVAETPPAREVAPSVLPGSEHVIEYHLIASGRCYGGLLGEPPLELSAGDLIIFPQGDAHVLSSAPGMRATPDLAAFRLPQGSQLPFALKEGGGGERVAMICGFLGCDARPFNPLLSALPKVLAVRGERAFAAESSASSSLPALLKLALAESKARRSGSECVLSRLSEVLFVEAIRTYIETLPPEQAGWLAGLRDAHVGRALNLLHDCPAKAWTLEDLADEVGVSRSVLAERFVHFVGIPPMQYLAKWRIQLAAERLRTSTDSLAEIAAGVGYGSESALSRAFKRVVGVSPSALRHV